MYVIADVTIIPMGVGPSVSSYIKVAHQKLVEANLDARLCPYGTVVEGEYTAVIEAVEKAMTALHNRGVPRLSVSLKIDSRTDKKQTAQDKIDAIIGD